MGKIFVLFTFVSCVQMATIEEGRRTCQVDADCTVEQYCYDVSHQCVNYTRCSRYNRAENTDRSRDASLCGDCLPGYTAEILGTGEKASSCKKLTGQGSVADPARLTNAVIIWIIIGILFTITLGVAGFLLRKKICCMRKEKKSAQLAELCVLEPTAPPAENSPFIRSRNQVTSEPFNNNLNLKDKNGLVKAIPFKEPNWVRCNPDYDGISSNENLNAVRLTHLSQLPEPDASTNTSVPEQVDANTNLTLVQRNSPSSSEARNSSSNSHSDNPNGSTSQSTYARGGRERPGTNILVMQKISTNINVLNGD